MCAYGAMTCGKTPFDKRGAQTKRNQLMGERVRHRKRRALYIYPCRVCAGGVWHLTHEPYFNGMKNL